MTPSWITRRLRAFFNRPAVEREMHDELALHFDLHVKALEIRGLSPLAARRQAAIDFAGVEQVKESYRDARGVRRLENVLQDLRYALRTLAGQRLFTAAVVLTFAIGIGATTAIYSLVDAAWFSWSRSFNDADRLVMVYKVFRDGGFGPTTPVDFRDWQEQARTVNVAAYVRGAATLAAEGEPKRFSSVSVTPEFFSVLQVRPLLGRFFRAEEAEWGNHGRVVLSYATWKRDFAGDSGVVGRKVTLNGMPAEITGVAARGSWFGSNGPEVYIPLTFAPDDPVNTRNSHFVFAVGRIAANHPLATAQAEMTAIMRRILAANPQTDGMNARVTPLSDVVLGDVQSTLTILLGAAALLLIIACANVTNLLLVRTTARARELAVRAALGASRGRLTQQLWTESVLLAALGGLLGIGVAAIIVGWLGASLPLQLPRIADTGVALDLRVLSIGFTIVLITGIVCGTLPAIHALRGHRSGEALRRGSRGTGGGRGASRVRGGLVSAQVALGVVLLVTTGLLTRSLRSMQGEDHGADGRNVLSLRLALPANARTDSLGTIRYYDDILRRVREVPGVTMAGVASHLPLSGGGETKSFWVEGRQPTSLDEVPRVVGRMESVDALRAMGVTLLSGRWFEERDRESAPYVAIIGESIARKHFAAENPIGKRISLFPPEALSPPTPRPRPRFTVIGVVKDVQYNQASSTIEDAVYVHYPQGRRVWAWGPEWLVVKTAQPAAQTGGRIRDAVRAADPSLPVSTPMPLDERMAQSFRAPRFTAGLIATFATVAVLLGIIGLYGVIAYSVAQETKAIGVRLALGATPREVAALVVRRGATLAGVGIVTGIAAAIGATRLIESQLFGVSALDPATYAGASGLLLMLAVAASWIPGRRAANTDAVIALRSD
jgi:putative ABC transport system permease protein